MLTHSRLLAFQKAVFFFNLLEAAPVGAFRAFGVATVCGFQTPVSFAATARTRRMSHSKSRISCKDSTDPFKTLWFENDRVRLYNVVIPPGEKISWMAENPLVRWLVGSAEYTLTRTDSADGSTTSSKLVLADKSVRYYDANPNVLWTLRNDYHRGTREIVFELLERSPRHTSDEVDAMRRACVYNPNVGTQLLLENDRCRAWDFSYEPGGGDPADVHQHTLDYIFCTPCDGPPAHAHAAAAAAGEAAGGAAQGGSVRLLGFNPDGSLQFDSVSSDGDVHWTTVTGGGFLADGTTPNPAFCHAGSNGYPDRPFVEYLLEIK